MSDNVIETEQSKSNFMMETEKSESNMGGMSRAISYMDSVALGVSERYSRQLSSGIKDVKN